MSVSTVTREPVSGHQQRDDPAVGLRGGEHAAAARPPHGRRQADRERGAGPDDGGGGGGGVGDDGVAGGDGQRQVAAGRADADGRLEGAVPERRHLALLRDGHPQRPLAVDPGLAEDRRQRGGRADRRQADRVDLLDDALDRVDRVRLPGAREDLDAPAQRAALADAQLGRVEAADDARVQVDDQDRGAVLDDLDVVPAHLRDHAGLAVHLGGGAVDVHDDALALGGQPRADVGEAVLGARDAHPVHRRGYDQHADQPDRHLPGEAVAAEQSQDRHPHDSDHLPRSIAQVSGWRAADVGVLANTKMFSFRESRR